MSTPLAHLTPRPRAALATLLAVLGAIAAAAPAQAQRALDQRRPAAPDGEVEILNPGGSTRVVGWDRPEVQVTGTLGPRAQDLDLATDAGRTVVRVRGAGGHDGAAATLEVRVPRRSRVQLKSVRGRLLVEDLSGSLRAESFEGAMVVTRGPAEVVLKSTSGSLVVQGAARRSELETVNGSITLRAAGGEVVARSVNGAVTVQGEGLTRVKVSTVSGPVNVEGSLTADALLEASSVNGSVVLALPSTTAAHFELSTTNGRISSQLADRQDDDVDHDGHGVGPRSRRFRVGNGGARVRASSVNGSVQIRKR